MVFPRRYFSASPWLLVGLLGAGSCSFSSSASAPRMDGGVAGIDADRPDASLSTGECLDAPYVLRAGSTQRYYLQTDLLDYDSAQTSCRVAGATLVVVNDLDEHDFVFGLGGGEPWIGFNDMDFEGTDNYEWVTKDSFAYTHWQGSEPNDGGGNEDCAILQQGGWGDRRCGELRPSVCECEPDRLVAPAPDCRTNEAYTALNEGRRYRLETLAANYKNATESCAADGAHLVVLSDERENEFVHNLSAGEGKWIGYSDAAAEGNFVWATGSPSEFNRWDGPQPDNNGDGEDCVEMLSNRSWNDATCELERQFVCECDPKFRGAPPSRL